MEIYADHQTSEPSEVTISNEHPSPYPRQESRFDHQEPRITPQPALFAKKGPQACCFSGRDLTLRRMLFGGEVRVLEWKERWSVIIVYGRMPHSEKANKVCVRYMPGSLPPSSRSFTRSLTKMRDICVDQTR